jgi:hypothetical protein
VNELRILAGCVFIALLLAPALYAWISAEREQEQLRWRAWNDLVLDEMLKEVPDGKQP